MHDHPSSESHEAPLRDEWLRSEGSVIYNSVGSMIMSQLESRAADIDKPSGSIDEVSRSMGYLVDQLSIGVDELVHELNPEGDIDFSYRENARDHASYGSQGSNSRTAINDMLAEGINTGLVISSKFTLLNLKMFNQTTDLTPSDISSAMATPAMNAMLITAAKAGLGFWGPFSLSNHIRDKEDASFEIGIIENEFRTNFEGPYPEEPFLLDDLVTRRNNGLKFTQLARDTMETYVKGFNHGSNLSQKTGICPVSINRVDLTDNDGLIQDISTENLGPQAKRSLTIGDPATTDNDSVGHFEGSVQFTPLIPRVNAYLANIIEAA